MALDKVIFVFIYFNAAQIFFSIMFWCCLDIHILGKQFEKHWSVEITVWSYDGGNLWMLSLEKIISNNLNGGNYKFHFRDVYGIQNATDVNIW